MELISYNVKCFPWLQTPIEQIVRWLTQQPASVVCLQEVWCRHDQWANYFKNAGWSIIWPPRERHIIGIFGSGLAIAYNRSLVTLQESSIQFTPFLNSIGMDATVPKGWLTAIFEQIQTGRIMQIVTTHMQADIWGLWITESIRRSQFMQIWQWLLRKRQIQNIPLLIAGDFNTETCWWPSGVWTAATAAPTFQTSDACIDHLYAIGMVLTKHKIHTDRSESDHWPVSWSLRFKPYQRPLLAPRPLLHLSQQEQSHLFHPPAL